MSGHSKWSSIKREKQAEDIKRGKVFTKLTRVISLAVRKGGSDPNLNPSLRAAIEKAHSYNMPKESIERATRAASTAAELKESIYEGYGPSGMAFFVKVLTDNRNRTLAEVRRIFDRYGGRLGEVGSVAYIFKRERENAENPAFTVPVTDRETARKVLTLANTLDEHDDVQEVFSNFDIPDELVHQMT